jgi:hypothetical protein
MLRRPWGFAQMSERPLDETSDEEVWRHERGSWTARDVFNAVSVTRPFFIDLHVLSRSSR